MPSFAATATGKEKSAHGVPPPSLRLNGHPLSCLAAQYPHRKVILVNNLSHRIRELAAGQSTCRGRVREIPELDWKICDRGILNAHVRAEGGE